jgi:murein DD-endopeptidase MepM/ murein hydrolase activator NlpD
MWAIAAAAGTVLKSEHGRVVESLGKGFQGSGWSLLYMHMANGGRVAVGTQVKTGDPIGHPSCEGGDANASHLHFARLYNGQWMGADMVPMTISGWIVSTLDQQYEGTITRGNQSRTACNCRDDAKNGITGDSDATGR